MHGLMVVVLTTVLFSADDSCDIEKMNGPWLLTSFTFNGVTKPGGTGVLTIEGNAVTKGGMTKGLTIGGKITLDPGESPKEFDLQYDKFRNGTVPPLFRGVYEIEGDTMRMCYTMGPNTERPKEFKAGAGSNCRIDVYKRK